MTDKPSALPEPFDAWWARDGKAGNPFDLRRAFNAGMASAGPCGCREGECESKVGPRCRMADEVVAYADARVAAAVLAERERIIVAMEKVAKQYQQQEGEHSKERAINAAAIRTPPSLKEGA